MLQAGPQERTSRIALTQKFKQGRQITDQQRDA